MRRLQPCARTSRIGCRAFRTAECFASRAPCCRRKAGETPYGEAHARGAFRVGATGEYCATGEAHPGATQRDRERRARWEGRRVAGAGPRKQRRRGRPHPKTRALARKRLNNLSAPSGNSPDFRRCSLPGQHESHSNDRRQQDGSNGVPKVQGFRTPPSHNRDVSGTHRGRGHSNVIARARSPKLRSAACTNDATVGAETGRRSVPKM